MGSPFAGGIVNFEIILELFLLREYSGNGELVIGKLKLNGVFIMEEGKFVRSKE